MDRKRTVGKNQGEEWGETENGGYRIEMTETWREKYNAKNTKVKRSAREERRNSLERRSAAEEKAAEKGKNYSRSCSALPSQ